MKVGDVVEWRGGRHHAIYKAGRIGVVTGIFTAGQRQVCRVLFPAPADELVVRQCFLKVLS